jgi:hypothetical protein
MKSPTTLFAAVAAAGMLILSSGPAAAGEIATRCDSYGCARIVCNHTGDRCHRVDGYGDRDRYGEDGYRSGHRWYGSRYSHDESYGAWHYDCDRDADSCYVRRGGSLD